MPTRWASLLCAACVFWVSSTLALSANELLADESLGRTLAAFTCNNKSVGLTITLTSAKNGCDPNDSYNEIVISMASGIKQVTATSSISNDGTIPFNNVFDFGCVAQDESYIHTYVFA